MSEKPEKPIKKLDDVDAFWLQDLYPDASILFQHSQPKIKEILKDCFIVLDANVLLWPYELASSSIDEIGKIYKEFSGSKKLVVPAQAAREFYKHRSRKIAAINDIISGWVEKAKKQIIDKDISMLMEDKTYKKVKELHSQIRSISASFIKEIEKISDNLQDEIGSDKISLLYKELFLDCVIDIPLDNDSKNAILSDAARRARLQIAPGYRDQNKPDGGIGDLIIWKTILQEGSLRNSNCIFITNEEKSDWWIKANGAFQPRPELIEEYRVASSGKSIHLLALSSFLFHFNAETKAVKEVQKLEEDKKSMLDSSSFDWETASKSLSNAIKKTNEERSIKRKELESIKIEIKALQEKIISGDNSNSIAEDMAYLTDLFKREKSIADALDYNITLSSIWKRKR